MNKKKVFEMVFLYVLNEILKNKINVFECVEDKKQTVYAWIEKNDLNILKNFHKKIIRKLPLHNSSTLKNLNKMYI